MKLQLSFTPRPWRWQWVAATSATVALGLVLGALLLVMRYREMGEDRSLLERRLERLSAQLQQQRSVQLPAGAARQALREKVAALNAQGAPKGWPTAQLLLWLETNMPADVRLVSLQHKARDGEALLVAESVDAASLTSFLQRLERDPAFAEVLLAKQGGRSGGDEAVRFEIRLRLQA
jgi:hypothetical protein